MNEKAAVSGEKNPRQPYSGSVENIMMLGSTTNLATQAFIKNKCTFRNKIRRQRGIDLTF